MMLLLVFAVSPGVPAFTQQTCRFQIPGDQEPIYGNWTNSENAGTSAKTSQKRVYCSRGLWRDLPANR
jgi:hypothetical protein